MPTEILDGNQTTTAPTSAPAQVNAQEFGQALARELAQNLKQAPTQEQKVDEINEVVAALKAAGLEDSDIQAHISTALGVSKKGERLIEEKIKATTTQFLQYQNEKELTSAIRRITRSYSKDDELIGEVSDAVRTFVRNEFLNGSTADVISARNKFFTTGDLDEDVLDDIVAKKVERIHAKGTGKKGTAAPSVKPSDTTTRPTDDEKRAVNVEDDMTEIQRGIYNSFKSTMRHAFGTPEELDKHALAAANRIKR